MMRMMDYGDSMLTFFEMVSRLLKLMMMRRSGLGETVCQVVVRMDREKVEKYEFVGIGEDGFPVDEGKVSLIDGKELEIWYNLEFAF